MLVVQVRVEDPLHRAIQAALGTRDLQPVQGRDPAREGVADRARHHHPESLHHVLAQQLGVNAQIHVEEDPARGRQDQMQGVFREVDLLAALGDARPALEESRRRIRHGRRVALDDLSVEDRLGEATAPQLSVGRQESDSEEVLEVLVELAARVILLVDLKDVPDALRTEDDVHEVGAETNADDVAVLASKVEEHHHRVAPERVEAAEQRLSARPRGEPPHRHRSGRHLGHTCTDVAVGVVRLRPSSSSRAMYCPVL